MMLTLDLILSGSRSFDESAWGTFDNNDDIDSVWGFDPNNSKVSQTSKLAFPFYMYKHANTHIYAYIYIYDRLWN